jgi:hypothetical protein
MTEKLWPYLKNWLSYKFLQLDSSHPSEVNKQILTGIDGIKKEVEQRIAKLYMARMKLLFTIRLYLWFILNKKEDLSQANRVSHTLHNPLC